MSERSLLMRRLPISCPPLPGLAGLAGSYKTYTPSPVWRDSTTDDMKFQPMPKRVAVKLYHRARAFERRTREPGKQDGALGRNGPRRAACNDLRLPRLPHRGGSIRAMRPLRARLASASAVPRAG
jgi:hypothetical protein